VKDLLNLEKTKVSKDIKNYDMLIYGESGIGKSEFALNVYGRERTIALAFEDSYTGISGVYAVNINSYSTLLGYLTQLKNPQVREKFDIIIIDTLFLLDHFIEKSICDSYGVELLGDALKYNKAYKIVDKKFLAIIKDLQKMGYTMVYIAHPATQKVEIGDKKFNKFKPKVSDRVKDLLLPEIDIQLFCYTDVEGNRKIASQKSQYWDARCRVSELAPCIDFDAEVLREEFAKGIEKKRANGENIVDRKEVTKEVEPTFEELMDYMNNTLAKKCAEQNVMQQANIIILNNLGRDDDGKPRTLADITPQMKETVKSIIVELENLVK
jgi:hypothetical protein